MTKLPKVWALALLALAALPAFPQLLLPGSRLLLVETPSFSIYFPSELEPEARRLAGFAESVLDAEAGLYGPRPGSRLSVLLADRFPDQNGFFTDLPSDRLVLEIAPASLDAELASAPDPLRALFAHELAHALSLSTRGPLARAGALLFGDPFAPAFWLGPRLLAEGTSIAAESGRAGGGQGRSTDPLARALLLQTLVEGRHPDFWEAAGAADGWPLGSAPYDFGGPFAAWLVARYGEGAFARLWAEFASLRPPEDFLFIKGAFSLSFGEDLPELWNAFLEDSTPSRPLLLGPRLIGPEEPGIILALTAGKRGGRGLSIWADAARGAVFELLDGEARPRRLFDIDGRLNRLDLSADGRYLLVSVAAEGPDGVLRSLVLVRDLEKGAFTGRRIEGLREAAWAGPDGPGGEGPVLGIQPRGIETDLALDEGGELRILLRGSPTRSYGSPVALGPDAFALLAREEGRSLLLRLRGATLDFLAPSQPLQNLRFLSGRGGSLAFAYAPSGRLYRLALLEDAAGDRPRLLLQELELSGGLSRPALRSDPGEEPRLSYVAELAEGRRLADYNFGRPELEPVEAAASWLALDPSFGSSPAEEPGPAPTFAPRPAPPLPLGLRSFRLPYFSSELQSAGLSLQGQDLGERLSWNLSGGWNWGIGAPEAGLGAELVLGPWNLSLAAGEAYLQASSSWWRSDWGSLGLERFFASFPSRRGLDLGLLAGGGALSPAAPGAPYGAASTRGLGGRASLSWSDRQESVLAPFEARGYELHADLDAETRDSSGPFLGLSAGFLGALPLAGIAADIEAGASPELGAGGLLLGPGGRLLPDGSPAILPALPGPWPLFAGTGLAGPWYARAELSARLFDLEIGKTFRPLWSLARRLGARAGLRAGAVAAPGGGEAELLYSGYAELAFDFSPLVGLFASTSLSAALEVEWTPLVLSGAPAWRLGLSLGGGR